MSNQPDVSIAMMTYYHEQYVSQAIESVLSQNTTYTYEIVISDDCSKDRTREILADYAVRYPDIIKVTYNEENLGISQNNYNTKCRCSGRYITPLSGDDYWIDPEKIQKQVDFLDAHPEYFAVVTSVEARYDAEIIPVQTYPARKYRGKEITLDMYLHGATVGTHGLMMRNLFLSGEGREYYSAVPQASRFIDDATECLLILNRSPVYSMDFSSVAYRIQKEKTGKHNYNSLNNALSHCKKDIDLYNYIHENVFPEMDLIHLYQDNVAVGILYSILKGKLDEFRTIFATVPKEYKKRGLLIRTLPRMIPLSFSAVMRRLKNH